MSVQVRKAQVLALMRAYNDSPLDHTIGITREGSVAAGPRGVPFYVWRCAPEERQHRRTLRFTEALRVLADLQASGAFDPH